MKNHIIKVLLSSITLMFNAPFVKAQKVFNQAQLILKDGSTKIGFIREINDERYTQNILFKLTKEESKIQKLNLSDLKSIFLIESKLTYECKEIDLTMTEEKDDNLPYIKNIEDYKSKIKTDKDVFLMKKILTGNIKMYEIIDKMGQAHYVVQKLDDQLIELQRIRYKREYNNSIFINSLDIFKDQLETLFSDCSRQYSLPSLKFSKEELLNAVNFYN